MRLIDLTMPLYEGMPNVHGHVAFKNHPIWPSPWKTEVVRSFEEGGAEFHVFTFFCEPGTRFILPSYRKIYKDDPRRLDTVDINKLIFRDAVVVDIPKGEREFIRPEDLEEAVNKAPCQRGDALLIRTGWGDDERYLKLGLAYRELSPRYTDTAGEKLMELLQSKSTDMWLYDNCEMTTPFIDGISGRRGSFTIRPGLTAIGGIVNAGAIKKPRVKLVIGPIKIKGVHMGPCRVIAIED
ncbi:MAG: cyclase family protein [Chloroflexi bacterium]|nr:cyclase family protein [Chloroflexota bacterium]MBI2979577.1 cyclase family protein [Chloroflexota bacterium]